MAERSQPTLFGSEAWALPDGVPVVSEIALDESPSPEQLVEPYGFVLTDPQQRWSVTLETRERVARGKVEREMVASCTCGWSWPVTRYMPPSFDSMVDHLRDHVLSASSPVIRVEEAREGWERVKLAGGRVHCPAPECHIVTAKRPSGPPQVMACPEHGGSLHSRIFHWETVDPAASAYSHERGLLRGPDGRLWHYWCAPEDGRRLFGLLREDEREASG